MMTEDKSPFPEVAIRGVLYCPHCGTRLFSWEDGFVAKCPHLVFAYAWGDPFFVAIRPDFAVAFLTALTGSDQYREQIEEDGGDPLDESDRKLFSGAAFRPDDPIASTIAAYCWHSPERMFPALLSPNTVIFADDRMYSGVHIAVDI